MIGFRGASRYAHSPYANGLVLECEVLAGGCRDMALCNLTVGAPLCPRVEEPGTVLDVMAANGLARGCHGGEVYMICKVPNNVVQNHALSEIFDGLFDPRHPCGFQILRHAGEGAHRVGRPIGVCGEAPATYPECAEFSTRSGVDNLSVALKGLGCTQAVDASANNARTSGLPMEPPLARSRAAAY